MKVEDLVAEDVLLNSLKALNIHVENHKALALLPLVFVAWSDGKIQRGERELILELAKLHHFIDEGGEGLLESWLQDEPTPAYFEQGFQLLTELARREREPGKDITIQTLQDLIAMGLDVAKAAGGLFGKFWTVSAEEEVALAKIANALSIDDGSAWRELQSELDKRDP